MRGLLVSLAAVFLSLTIYLRPNTDNQQALLLESKQANFVVGSREILKCEAGELLLIPEGQTCGAQPPDRKIQKYLRRLIPCHPQDRHH